jgi:CheY-like chemotaxis protein
VSERPRILIVHGCNSLAKPAQSLLEQGELVAADCLPQVLALLRADHFDLVCADATDPSLPAELADLVRCRQLLAALADGVALVDVDLKVIWANSAFEVSCGGPVRGRGFYEALGSPETLGPDYSPFHSALSGQPATARLHCRNNRFLELHVSSVPLPDSSRPQMVTLLHDVTDEVLQQQVLDALHKASSELASLAPDELADMSSAERIELLKANIRRLTHDLLHYDTIEIRLLARHSGLLEPLLEEGITPEAAQRVLHALPRDNGVTGYVAATGKSYLCPETANDPLYLEGRAGARSSLTVPLLFEDQVIGTFNVESPQRNAFSQRDVQFAEIFAREIATALHTLELLSAEKHGTALRSIEAISREVDLPVDDILTAATSLLDRCPGEDQRTSAQLRQILKGARAIKELIQKTGEELVPSHTPASNEEPAHAALKGKRILVADGDERIRRSAHVLLGRWGCVVEAACDAQQALALARLSAYDFILADIRLPDRSGYEAYCDLRRAQPDARVILMTSFGYDPSHTLVKARQDGPCFVLYKPLRTDQLLKALESTDPAPQPQVVRA